MEYQPVIGLEIHAELKTQSKMFCDCKNDPDEVQANVNICPVCTAQPGSLPVPNQQAIEMVIKTGLAIGGQISNFSKFDRKNYFYPDLPKNYQISQYDLPLVEKGSLEINGKKIRITRIHLEEDTGKLNHPEIESGRADYSLIDFNRAGRPLMELVTEPDIENGEQARKFGEELQLILRYLDVSEANMEKGQMRCEVNISLRQPGKKMGTKVEIKNLNSFRSVGRSIDYEIKRQAEALDSGEKIIQETRGWDDAKQKTFSQRIKEEAHDYRYLPEPDIPPLNNLSLIKNELSKTLPELPSQKRKRFIHEFNLPEADVNILVFNKELADYFERVVSELATWVKIKKLNQIQPLVKLTANYFLTQLQKLLAANRIKADQCQISAENFAEFIAMIGAKEISSSAAQTILEEMFNTGADPSHVVEDKQLKQVSDEGELDTIVKQVIQDNPQPVSDYKEGKEKALQFLVGKVMAASKGQANPEIAAKMLKEEIK